LQRQSGLGKVPSFILNNEERDVSKPRRLSTLLSYKDNITELIKYLTGEPLERITDFVTSKITAGFVVARRFTFSNAT